MSNMSVTPLKLHPYWIIIVVSVPIVEGLRINVLQLVFNRHSQTSTWLKTNVTPFDALVRNEPPKWKALCKKSPKEVQYMTISSRIASFIMIYALANLFLFNMECTSSVYHSGAGHVTKAVRHCWPSIKLNGMIWKHYGRPARRQLVN